MSTLTLATWNTRRPRFLAIAVAVGGTILTAFGSAAGQALGLNAVQATLVLAGFVALSALLGLLWMRLSHHSLPSYGWRVPTNLRAIAYGAPLCIAPALNLLAGVTIPTPLILASLLLCCAVAFNEEIWFRGLLLAALRTLGARSAIVIGSVLFGVLHLANAFNSKSPLYLVLQLLLAFLVGLVLSEAVAITGSLWVGIVWHLAYDFTAMLSGDQLTGLSLISAGIIDAVLLVLAVSWWRKLSSKAD